MRQLRTKVQFDLIVVMGLLNGGRAHVFPDEKEHPEKRVSGHFV